MCPAPPMIAPESIDDFADLRRSSETSALPLVISALLIGIVLASTTLYLKGLDGAASILLN